ncbi:basic Helix-Loop-Helix 105, iaa-leucine resistant3 [Hibiscus trionum]|uniref:Basic Helix-Loop-Helix 105, iaa-leucine resistant3 n=1 Tax=Hibiscus trionum TaxID=183268 RepID=A0A9W7MV21_HIBTR|nr:basic Helix-Loop-Helix 105, iaa-leucine resistant3 [Hibiscus trionum]
MISRQQPNGAELVSSENPNAWMLDDYGLLDDITVPGGDLPSLHPSPPIWSSNSLTCAEFNESFGNSDNFIETGSRKRVRSGTCSAAGSKACREKMRRDRLNDRFLELGSILDPGRPPKVDKALILVDAVRMVTHLRDEALKLKESNESLQEKINELKAEKNELRDEKQRLKAEKENLERQVKALGSHPGFPSHLPAIPSPFTTPGQVVGGKPVPYAGYPGVSMWQFLPPAAFDTSQDHVLRPPVA